MVYQVNRTHGALDWQQAVILDDFSLPWNEETPQSTSFRALHDGQYLYFRFEVQDKQLNLYMQNNHKLEAASSDRVELFFKADDAMQPYYCLEIDFAGRILDYRATFYRQMEYEWQWPDSIRVETQTCSTGYQVEGQISLFSLQSLGLLQDSSIQAGIFRADYSKDPLTGTASPKWISWIDPQTQKPDFHVPSAFGTIKFKDL